MIHINFTSAEVDPVYFPQVEVIGDIADSISRIGEALPANCDRDYSFFKKVRTALTDHIQRKTGDNRFPISPQRLVADIRSVMPPDGIIALDNGIYKIWFARNYPANLPNTVLLDNALAAMGAGLPSAIVAKMVHRDCRVMAICGDGGFMMNSQELQTAVRLDLDLVVVVLCDNAFGMVKWKQQDMNFNDYGLNFTNPDFVRYAESYGAIGHLAGKTARLTTIVEGAFDAGGVHLIEVPVDYSDNYHILNQEIRGLSKQL